MSTTGSNACQTHEPNRLKCSATATMSRNLKAPRCSATTNVTDSSTLPLPIVAPAIITTAINRSTRHPVQEIIVSVNREPLDDLGRAVRLCAEVLVIPYSRSTLQYQMHKIVHLNNIYSQLCLIRVQHRSLCNNTVYTHRQQENTRSNSEHKKNINIRKFYQKHKSNSEH